MLSRILKTRYVSSGAREIVFKENSVIRRVDPRYARTQFAVEQAAQRLAAASAGLFYVPLILRQEPATGIVESEKITGLLSLRDRFATGLDCLDLLERTGRTLAYIHKYLWLPEASHVRVSSDWDCANGDSVCLHGDFNINNVCSQPQTDRLVILDWASVGVISRGKTVGSRYLDTGKFLRSLLCQQRYPLDAIRNFNKRAKAFLKGYQSEMGPGFNLQIAKEYLLKMARRRVCIQFRRKEFRKVIGNSIVHALLRVFCVTWAKRMTADETPHSRSAPIQDNV